MNPKDHMKVAFGNFIDYEGSSDVYEDECAMQSFGEYSEGGKDRLSSKAEPK